MCDASTLTEDRHTVQSGCITVKSCGSFGCLLDNTYKAHLCCAPVLYSIVLAFIVCLCHTVNELTDFWANR
jgi:hypothetical protein